MKYLQKSFSVLYGGKAYRDGWEKVFGGEKEKQPECINIQDYGTYLARLEELFELTDGWFNRSEKDGKAISSLAIKTARFVGSVFAQYKTSIPHLYPDPVGGINLEWDKPGIEILAYIDVDGSIDWSRTDNDYGLITHDVNLENVLTAMRQIGLSENVESQILERAIEVFGSKERAESWLCNPCPSIGNCIPLEEICTESGIELILQILGRIEHGVYS